jgi:hypothetical protein
MAIVIGLSLDALLIDNSQGYIYLGPTLTKLSLNPLVTDTSRYNYLGFMAANFSLNELVMDTF